MFWSDRVRHRRVKTLFLLLFFGSTRLAAAVDPECHDPSRLMPDGGGYALYCSGENGEALTSRRLDPESGLWSDGAPIFAGGVPAWTEDVQVWNPTGEFDAPAWGDTSHLYFTVFDEEGASIQDAIGLARSTGSGVSRTWEDRGIVLRSEGEGDHPRAMDPAVVSGGDGRLWMVFGSHAGGIYLVELDAATGLLLENPEDPWADPTNGSHPDRFVHLASYGGSTADENAIEAPFLHRHEGFWYLFVNWDRCCSGTASDYNIRVGRSTTIEGPYLDRNGVDMADGGGTLVLDADGVQLGDSRYVGPGHAAITAAGDRDVFTFHYYDASDGGRSRVAAKILTWDAANWPVVTSEDFGGGSGGADVFRLAKLKAANLTDPLGNQSFVVVTDVFGVAERGFDPATDALDVSLSTGALTLWQGQIPAGLSSWRRGARRYRWRGRPGEATGGLAVAVLAWKRSGDGKLKLKAKGAAIDDSDVGSTVRVHVGWGDVELTFVPDVCWTQSEGSRLTCR